MKIILIAVYGLAAVLALFCGWVYPAAKLWSHLAAGAFAVHLLLAMVVSLCKLMDAAKIAAYCWQGLSALVVPGLLLLYSLGKGGGWLIAAVGLLLFTMLVTLVFCLVLRQGGMADNR